MSTISADVSTRQATTHASVLLEFVEAPHQVLAPHGFQDRIQLRSGDRPGQRSLDGFRIGRRSQGGPGAINKTFVVNEIRKQTTWSEHRLFRVGGPWSLPGNPWPIENRTANRDPGPTTPAGFPEVTPGSSQSRWWATGPGPGW